MRQNPEAQLPPGRLTLEPSPPAPVVGVISPALAGETASANGTSRPAKEERALAATLPRAILGRGGSDRLWERGNRRMELSVPRIEAEEFEAATAPHPNEQFKPT